MAQTAEFNEALERAPTDLETLKGVLAAVRRVLDAKVVMETECADVQERVTTMKVRR